MSASAGREAGLVAASGGQRPRVLVDVGVSMRDGVRLSADVYLPRTCGPVAAVVTRTPYDSTSLEFVELGRRFADGGYAFVVQDVRGRGDSDGTYRPFVHDAEDGLDTLAWVARQSWCDGRVGMTGESYGAWAQWAVAASAGDGLRCIVPATMTTDVHGGLMFPGGAWQLSVLAAWTQATHGRTTQSHVDADLTEVRRCLPLARADRRGGRDLPLWREWLAHPEREDFWEPYRHERWEDVAAPALLLGGWFDFYAAETLRAFVALRARASGEAARGSRVVMGPWTHGCLGAGPRVGELDLGPQAQLDVGELELGWFDRWLKDDRDGTAAGGAPVRLFVMGANRWRDEHEWPLARTDWQAWYLHSRGGANTLLGDGTLSADAAADREPPDGFVYDPAHPVPSAGGAVLIPPGGRDGPRDQGAIEMRADVLCYTSAPLERDLEVTGPVRLVLFAATDGLDTDWTAKLVDVWPDGRAIGVCDGIVRARYRDSRTDPSPVTPGDVHRYEIDVGVTSSVFKAGHRLRVEVSSSNFPRFDRNLNTGRPIDRDDEPRIARQTVHHDHAHPSHILLPVIPTETR